MRKTIFIKNAAIMTATGTILRLLGIFFKVFVAAKIGSEGMGLYQLVFSVYVLASTFAASGITVAVTRLCANEISLGKKDGLLMLLRRSFTISLLLAFITFTVLLFGSDFIADDLLKDNRARLSILIFAFSLPFMAISSVIKGYFAARRKAAVNSAAVLIEQAARIIFCLIFLNSFDHLGAGGGVAAIMAGDTIAEIIALIYTYIIYRLDLSKLRFSGSSQQFKGTRELIRISAPITAGRYSTTILRTIENVIMPRALHKSSLSFSSALSAFGALKGMALPVLFFPSSILSAFSTLLIPEMSEALARKNLLTIKHSTEKVLKVTWLLGAVFGCLFFISGKRVGDFIYHDDFSGYFIKVLAPLVPLMYLDSISDGILKGLDKQVFTFAGALIDSASRIILILLFVPKYGINAFIYIMYISNLLTFILNMGKLLRVTGIKIRILETVIIPVLSAFGFSLLFNSLFSFIRSDLLYICITFGATILCYGASVFILQKRE